ncbi:MAG: hypothetical protein A2X56_08900 [Nitrospirae bacterium GWC2_57_13]|jgi:hypothetical protein|nr:MAG: hypothetical protein A2X56_08900 [Nitrospirae bacterium GWC2_57_13]
MKKIIIVLLAAVIVAVAGVPAFASGMTDGGMGINVGYGNSIYGDLGVTRVTGKYFITRDMAILAGLGLQSSSGDYDADYFGLLGGFRKYLSTSDLATFIEGKLVFESIEFTSPGSTAKQNADTIDISFGFGAEYYFSKQFSVEGSVGFGFGTVEFNTALNPDYSYFGTRTAGVSANFYF